MSLSLAYTETSLPGEITERRELANRFGLALEIEDWGEVEPSTYRRAGSRVATVQTCRLKRDPPTAPGRRERSRALRHVEEALELADRLEARRIITICAYGTEAADSPFERALDLFDRAGRRARELGVRVLVEPLSPKRSPLFHDPAEINRLLRTLDQPANFGLALDTGHLADGDRDPDEIFATLDYPVAEIQLRGPDGAPPSPELPVAEWVGALPSALEVLAVEHREAIEHSDFEALVEALRPLVV